MELFTLPSACDSFSDCGYFAIYFGPVGYSEQWGLLRVSCGKLVCFAYLVRVCRGCCWEGNRRTVSTCCGCSSHGRNVYGKYLMGSPIASIICPTHQLIIPGRNYGLWLPRISDTCSPMCYGFSLAFYGFRFAFYCDDRLKTMTAREQRNFGPRHQFEPFIILRISVSPLLPNKFPYNLLHTLRPSQPLPRYPSI